MKSFMYPILLATLLVMATADVLPDAYRHVWKATHDTSCESADLSSVVNGTGDSTVICFSTTQSGSCTRIPTTGVYQVVGSPNWYFIQTASSNYDDDFDDDDIDDYVDDAIDDDVDDDIDDDVDDDIDDDVDDDIDDDVDDDIDDDVDDDYFWNDDDYPDVGFCIYINQPENLMLISNMMCVASAPSHGWNIEEGKCPMPSTRLRGSKKKIAGGRKKARKPSQSNVAKAGKSTKTSKHEKKHKHQKRRSKAAGKAAANKITHS